jgi:hypothetical protein
MTNPTHPHSPRHRLARIAAAVLTMLGAGAAAASTPQEAAQAVATGDAQCRALGDFYWEIGNAQGVQGSGKVGDDYAADKPLRIASASKFVWGAYVLEKIGGAPSAEQVRYLEMGSGYTSFNPIVCAFSRTVDACLNARSNGELTPSNVGLFSYGGGHDQKLASIMGLGSLSTDALTAEVRQALGGDLAFGYHSPQLAGGMESTPAEFGKFLRKVLSGQLRLKSYLGYAPVCTQPGPTCTTAIESPALEPWHYSLNHWVEDAPATGDGAYSSPGAMGFYPWISKDKTTYGILARQKLGSTAYWDSALCGRKIRAAWMGAE